MPSVGGRADLRRTWVGLELLVAEGLDRVEVGGLAGGVPAEEDADGGADEEGDDDGSIR